MMVGIFACQVKTSIDSELKSRNQVRDFGSRKTARWNLQAEPPS
jgi:hypothetical protein